MAKDFCFKSTATSLASEKWADTAWMYVYNLEGPGPTNPDYLLGGSLHKQGGEENVGVSGWLADVISYSGSCLESALSTDGNPQQKCI